MMPLTEVARAVGAATISREVVVQGISTDSRSVKPGDLFVALTGARFDGHEFVAAALEQGAVAALVERPLGADLPALVVPDSRVALGALAKHWRDKFSIPVIAVTGSNGKTTVKEMLSRVLEQKGEVLATQGNLNNDIGVPLTLLRLRPNHHCAVIEMGANKPGEIAYLSGLARPQVAIVTNAAPAHLAGFGSVADVVKAKSEIFSALGGDGVAVINQDDAHTSQFRANAAPHRIVSFGFSPTADVRTDPAAISTAVGDRSFQTRFRVDAEAGQFDVCLALAGLHNVMNALAVTAATLSIGVTPEEIVAGLAKMQPVAGRLVPRTGINGLRLIDDSYNANPGSVKAAIDVLMTCVGPRVLALGDMLELGVDAAILHGEVGHYAREKGVDALYATGAYCQSAVDAFGPGAWFFADSAALGSAMRDDILTGRLKASTILVKGSRGMAMEKVVTALQNGGGTTGSKPERAVA